MPPTGGRRARDRPPGDAAHRRAAACARCVLFPAMRHLRCPAATTIAAAERQGDPYLVYADAHGSAAGALAPRFLEPDHDRPRDGADVPLTWDPDASRVHAELVRLADAWVVVDDGLSRNGTFVNGERVDRRRRLLDGDQLRVGRTPIRFRAPFEHRRPHDGRCSRPVTSRRGATLALAATALALACGCGGDPRRPRPQRRAARHDRARTRRRRSRRQRAASRRPCPPDLAGCRQAPGDDPLRRARRPRRRRRRPLRPRAAARASPLPGSRRSTSPSTCARTRCPGPGEQLAAAGQVQTGSYGQSQIHAIAVGPRAEAQAPAWRAQLGREPLDVGVERLRRGARGRELQSAVATGPVGPATIAIRSPRTSPSPVTSGRRRRRRDAGHRPRRGPGRSAFACVAAKRRRVHEGSPRVRAYSRQKPSTASFCEVPLIWLRRTKKPMITNRSA